MSSRKRARSVSPESSSTCEKIVAAAEGRGEPPSDVCDTLPACIRQITGLTGASESSTQLWELQPRSGGGAVLKIWSNARRERVIGSNYEQRVYRNVVTPLVLTGRCTSFIRLIADGVNCSFRSVVELLQAAMPTRSRADIMAGLHSNIRDVENRAPRRSIESAIAAPRTDVTPVEAARNERARYSYILLSSAPKAPGASAAMVVDDVVPNVTNPVLTRSRASLLFSIAFALYAMHAAKLWHADLHMHNIFVKPLNPPVRRTYVVDGIFYTHLADYDIFVYDFDRSFAAAIGGNYDHVIFRDGETFVESFDFAHHLAFWYGCDEGASSVMEEGVFAYRSSGHRPAEGSFRRLIFDLLLRRREARVEDALQTLMSSSCHFNVDGTASTSFVSAEVRPALDIFRLIAHIACVETTPVDAESVHGVINANEFAPISGAIKAPARPPVIPKTILRRPLPDVTPTISLAAARFAAAGGGADTVIAS